MERPRYTVRVGKELLPFAGLVEAEELERRLAESPGQILILGISQIAGIAERFQALLGSQPRWPVLVVYRPADNPP